MNPALGVASLLLARTGRNWDGTTCRKYYKNNFSALQLRCQDDPQASTRAKSHPDFLGSRDIYDTTCRPSLLMVILRFGRAADGDRTLTVKHEATMVGTSRWCPFLPHLIKIDQSFLATYLNIETPSIWMMNLLGPGPARRWCSIGAVNASLFKRRSYRCSVLCHLCSRRRNATNSFRPCNGWCRRACHQAEGGMVAKGWTAKFIWIWWFNPLLMAISFVHAWILTLSPHLRNLAVVQETPSTGFASQPCIFSHLFPFFPAPVVEGFHHPNDPIHY